MNEELFLQIVITLLGFFCAIICVILGWYLKKRETCNRIKENLQKQMVKKVDEIYNKLKN